MQGRRSEWRLLRALIVNVLRAEFDASRGCKTEKTYSRNQKAVNPGQSEKLTFAGQSYEQSSGGGEIFGIEHCEPPMSHIPHGERSEDADSTQNGRGRSAGGGARGERDEKRRDARRAPVRVARYENMKYTFDPPGILQKS